MNAVHSLIIKLNKLIGKSSNLKISACHVAQYKLTSIRGELIWIRQGINTF